MKKLIAFIKSEDNSCELVALCKNVDDNEYKKLTNEMVSNKGKQRLEIETILNKIACLETKIKELTNEIKVLKGEEE